MSIRLHNLIGSYSNRLHGMKSVTARETAIAHACKVGKDYV